MDIKTIDKALYDWINGFTNTVTIWRNENAPSPYIPYIAIYIPQLIPVGQDSFIAVDIDGMSTYISNNRVSFQVEYFGKDGLAVLESLKYSMHDEVYQLILSSAGISVLSYSVIRDLTFLQDSKYEKRFLLEIELLLSSIYTVKTEIIQTVEMVGKIFGSINEIEKEIVINKINT